MSKLTPSEFTALCESLLAALADAAWPMAAQKDIPYGVSFTFVRGGMVNLYNGKKGPKAVIAGQLVEAEERELQSIIDQVIGGDARKMSQPASIFGAAPSSAGSLMGWSLPWIGVDESGKGDYFGPLVAAACVMTPDGIAAAQKAGITDSKALGDREIAEMARWIEANHPTKVALHMPHDYNRIYAQKRNINVILGELHATCIRALNEKTGATHALSDRFGPERHVTMHLSGITPPIIFRAQPKAERDIAVAAASIIARAEFVQQLKNLSSEATMKLPLGAGPPVLKAGRDYLRLFGPSELGKYAKLHFKTSQDIGLAKLA